MKLTNRMSLVLVGGIVASLSFVGCRDSFKDCENTLSCPSQGDGDGDTGGDVGDGDTGGNGNGGEGGESGTGGAPEDPCTMCPTDKPHCSTEQECVECFDSEEHCGDETPVCDVEGGGVCVGCLVDGDCKTPELPVCDAQSKTCVAECAGTEDCERFEDTPVCDEGSGECVGCLSRTDCSGDVCERATNTCVEGRVAGDVSICGECEYDDDCEEGQLCVEQVFPLVGGTAVGSFCTWTKEAHVGGGTCSQDGKPYAALSPAATSVEGTTADLCVLGRTTCVAFRQHTQSVSGCVDESAMSDAACGVDQVDDGRCIENNENVPLCTYPCSNALDCVGNFTCIGPADQKYCSLL